MAYQRNPIKNAPEVPYHGETIEPINKMHWQQQIHKYNIALFVTGIVAMASALISIILIGLALAGKNSQAIASATTASNIVFVIALGADIVFTCMLNKYYKNKVPLILFIPAFVLMVVFCVPELIAVISSAFNLPYVEWAKSAWASYIVIVICCLFIIFEILRMILHRDDLDIYKEIKKALR